MGREQVTRLLIHILSKQIHLFTKWVMLCEVIDFRMPSVFSEALASGLSGTTSLRSPYISLRSSGGQKGDVQQVLDTNG